MDEKPHPQYWLVTFTRREAADLLRMSVRTLDGHTAARRIGFSKIGGKVLIRACDIEAFLAKYAIPPRERSWAIW